MTQAPGSGRAARPAAAKGAAAFRTISEASAELGVPQHVLRFWETRFSFISPTKRAGGRRFYRPQDLDVLRGVRVLLQDEGYTIKGVQKLHREQGLKRLLAASGACGTAAGDPAEAAQTPVPPPPLEPPSGVASPVAPPHGPEEGGADLLEGEETGDLFAAGPQRPLAEGDLPPEAPAPRPPGGRPVLATGARARLSDVLDDLEAVKAEIDALLVGG